MKFLFATELVLACIVYFSASSDAYIEGVSTHGRLSVDGAQLLNHNGAKLGLKGMSLFWDVWMPQYYNKETVAAVHESCYSNVIRAAITVESERDGGYILSSQKSLERLYAVIDAAILNDMYVVVDWHDHEAEYHQDSSLEFFNKVSKKYSGVPNVLYEPFNEPTNQSWSDVLKPYHEAVIKTIRANDEDAIIIVGTPNWSQGVDQAAADPITGYSNIMYALHFYAGTHKQELRDTATEALNNGIPIFVTEYGTVNADGDGDVDADESKLWFDWLNEHSISFINWAISDKLEGASALVANATADQVCQEEYLTESGKLVVAQNSAEISFSV